MSCKLALAATTALLLIGLGDAAASAEADPKAAPAPLAKAARPAPSRKANAVERAEAARLPALEQATFWAHEAALDPTDAEAGLKFAQALRRIGQTDEAVLAAQKVLVLHPDDVEVLLELARDHIARNESFYAIDPLKRAGVLAPRDWRAKSLLGVAYDQLDRPADARVAWDAALKLSPDNPAILSNLALSLAATGDAVRAEQLLRKAAASPAATVKTRQNLALVLGLQGKTAEAEAIIRDDVPPNEAAADLAWLRGPAPSVSGPIAAAASPSKGASRSWASVEGSSAAK